MYSFEVHDSDDGDGRESSRSRTAFPDFHANYNEGRSSSVPPSLLQQQQQQMSSNGQARIGSPVAFRGGRPPPPNGPRPGHWPPRSLSPRYYRPPPGFKYNNEESFAAHMSRLLLARQHFLKSFQFEKFF